MFVPNFRVVRFLSVKEEMQGEERFVYYINTVLATLRILQLNLHKRQEANMQMNEWLGSDNREMIALCQEPAQHRGRITNINRKISVIVGVCPQT